MAEENQENQKQRAEAIIRDIEQRQCPASPVRCEHILLPTDGSGQAVKALGEAVSLASVTGAEITLLMVVDYDREVAAFEQVSLGGYVPAELKISAYRYLADLMHVVPAKVNAHSRVEVGDPREVILDVAEEEHTDLIVMGTHGFGTFRSILMGSVSRVIMERAACPVLFVKGLSDDWADEDNYCPQ